MSDRDNLLDNLETRLETITVVEGYTNNVRAVERKELGYGDCKSFPTISIMAGDEEYEPVFGGRVWARLPVTLRGIVSNKSDPAGAVDGLLTDILKCVENAGYVDQAKILSISGARIHDDWAYADTDGFGAVEIDIVFWFSFDPSDPVPTQAILTETGETLIME